MKKKLILLLSAVLVISSGYINEVSAAAADPALQIAQGQPSEVPVQNQGKGADGKKEENKADAVPNVIKGLPPNLPKSIDPQNNHIYQHIDNNNFPAVGYLPPGPTGKAV